MIPERGPYWEEQIRALGNAVVPACALVVGTLLADWIREEEEDA